MWGNKLTVLQTHRLSHFQTSRLMCIILTCVNRPTCLFVHSIFSQINSYKKKSHVIGCLMVCFMQLPNYSLLDFYHLKLLNFKVVFFFFKQQSCIFSICYFSLSLFFKTLDFILIHMIMTQNRFYYWTSFLEHISLNWQC